MAHACLATSIGWQWLFSRDVSYAHQIKVWRWSLRCSTPSAATGFYNVAYRNIKLYYLCRRRRLLLAVKLATVWNVQSHPVVSVLWRDRRSMPVRAEWAPGCWEHGDTNARPIAQSLDIFYMYNLPDVTEFACTHTVAFLHLYVGCGTKTYSG